MLGISPSTLTRAMTSDGVTKHEYGRRDKKISPSDALDYARDYGVDPSELAEKIMEQAEKAGADAEQVATVESEISTWLITAMRNAKRENPQARLDALMSAIREEAAPKVATAIFAKAGFD